MNNYLTIHKILDTIKIVFHGIRTNILRGILTTLGVTVGIVAVVGMGTMAYSFQKEINAQFSVLGSNTFILSRQPMMMGHGGSWRDYWRRQRFEVDYMDEIMENCPNVKSITPYLWYNFKAKSKHEEIEGLGIQASNENVFDFSSYKIADGRFLVASDIQYNRNVCILDHKATEILFPHGEDPIEQRIKINNIPFKVIGVLEKETSTFGGEQNAMAIIPYSVAEKYWGRGWGLRFLVEALPDRIEQAMDEVIIAMRNLRGLRLEEDNDFEIFSSQMIRDAISKITTIAYIVIIGIAAISLLVGGIGIMNVMFVAVTERTKEIGIRKSCGARSKDILVQFGTEATVLSTIGGIIGLLLVFILTIIGNRFLPFEIIVPAWLVITGILFAAFVGIVFGIFPAYRASKKDPVIALRYE
ncbi:ABC transporter permease [bacterium]|nr:ABC transporter permease [bacterium]